jgi:hypothetical protein
MVSPLIKGILIMANPQIQNDPIYLLPFLYIQGLNISVAGPRVLAIAPGQARDSTDNIDMPVGFPNLQGIVYPPILDLNYQQPLFINANIVGANGLDSGVIAASSNYLVYLIGDSGGYKPVAGLLSLYSNPYPLLPEGYDSYRLLGFASTDASSNFVIATANIRNYAYAKSYYLQPEVSVLASGNATVYTAVDLSAAIPTTTDVGVIAYLDVIFTPAAIGDVVQLRPTGGGSGANNVVTISGIAAGVPQRQFQQVLCGVLAGVPSIDYRVSSASDSVNLLVSGYTVTLS